MDIGKRRRDERPAEFQLRAGDFAFGRRIDLASLEVTRVNPETGQPQSGPLALRWYDDAIPYDFPECEQNIHATDGLHLSFVSHPRWGDFYNILGEGVSGRLAWVAFVSAEKQIRPAIAIEIGQLREHPGIAVWRWMVDGIVQRH